MTSVKQSGELWSTVVLPQRARHLVNHAHSPPRYLRADCATWTDQACTPGISGDATPARTLNDSHRTTPQPYITHTSHVLKQEVNTAGFRS